MRRCAAFLTVFLILLAGALPAGAQQRIVALVNDEVISARDVENRVRLTLASSGLENSDDNRRRVQSQALRALVDEKVQAQEASRLGIFATDREVADAIARIEQANRLPRGQLVRLLEQGGIGMTALEQQVRGALVWQKLIQRRLRPQVQIADDEIDEVYEGLKARQGSPEFLLAEIFLPVENPDQDDEVRQTATSLIQQIQRGAGFAAVAQQFSRSATAGSGGDLGWVQEGQLDAELEAAVKSMRVGEVSQPIRSPGGYYILGLRNRRAVATAPPDEAVVALTQLVFPAANAQELAASQQLAETARRSVGDCAGLAGLARELRIAPPAEAQRLRVADVNPSIRDKVRQLQAGQTSEPIRSGSTLVVLVACARDDPPSGLPSKSDIEETLLRQRLELLSRRYLRDLRRQANVEIRG
jgi:peptidyl-prolyl cis-trans isomerase SurA